MAPFIVPLLEGVSVCTIISLHIIIGMHYLKTECKADHAYGRYTTCTATVLDFDNNTGLACTVRLELI